MKLQQLRYLTEIARRGLNVSEAAEAFIQAGAGQKAAELYLGQGQHDKAALLSGRFGAVTVVDNSAEGADNLWKEVDRVIKALPK